MEVARLTTAMGEEIAQRERLNRELEIAREVQERLFPLELPACPASNTAAVVVRPARGEATTTTLWSCRKVSSAWPLEMCRGRELALR